MKRVSGIKRKSKNVSNKFGNVKLTYKGQKFSSKLEVFMYKQLELLKTPFKYEGKSYTVLPGFTYQEEKVRPITYKPDFRLDDYPVIIETKGKMSDSFPLRFKLFKRSLINDDDVCDLFLPRNQKDCLEVIKIIKERYNL
jgi:hypothetical protein